MNLKDMQRGCKYLVGDGGGYDVVECLGTPSQAEVEAYFGNNDNAPSATFMKVLLDGQEQIFMESDGYHLYIEPHE